MSDTSSRHSNIVVSSSSWISLHGNFSRPSLCYMHPYFPDNTTIDSPKSRETVSMYLFIYGSWVIQSFSRFGPFHPKTFCHFVIFFSLFQCFFFLLTDPGRGGGGSHSLWLRGGGRDVRPRPLPTGQLSWPSLLHQVNTVRGEGVMSGPIPPPSNWIISPFMWVPLSKKLRKFVTQYREH